MLRTPSGQHGHGFESCVRSIVSAQGMSFAGDAIALDMAVTIGADSNSCAATNT